MGGYTIILRESRAGIKVHILDKNPLVPSCDLKSTHFPLLTYLSAKNQSEIVHYIYFPIFISKTSRSMNECKSTLLVEKISRMANSQKLFC